MPFSLKIEDDTILSRVDRLAYQYFCLSDDEIVLVNDAVEKIIPAVQPHEGGYPEIWKAPTESDRRAYATTLVASVAGWLRNEGTISPRLEACSADLAVLSLALDGKSTGYTEARDTSLAEALSRIADNIHQPLDGNFQLVPDLRVFVGKKLYLIKPMQQRFWLKSTALADADAIAMDLQDAAELEKRRSQT